MRRRRRHQQEERRRLAEKEEQWRHHQDRQQRLWRQRLVTQDAKELPSPGSAPEKELQGSFPPHGNEKALTVLGTNMVGEGLLSPVSPLDSKTKGDAEMERYRAATAAAAGGASRELEGEGAAFELYGSEPVSQSHPHRPAPVEPGRENMF